MLKVNMINDCLILNVVSEFFLEVFFKGNEIVFCNDVFYFICYFFLFVN